MSRLLARTRGRGEPDAPNRIAAFFANGEERAGVAAVDGYEEGKKEKGDIVESHKMGSGK